MTTQGAPPRSAPARHTKHGRRALAEPEPQGLGRYTCLPAVALGLMALAVGSVGLTLSLLAARPLLPAKGSAGLPAPGLASAAGRAPALPELLQRCARPIERRARLNGTLGEVVCADDLGEAAGALAAADWQAGDAWVEEADGRWHRHPGGMYAPLRLLLDLPLHLNSASAADLALLGGLSGRQARAIVAHRARCGPFASVAELRRVHGVGPKTVAKVQPFLALGSGQPALQKDAWHAAAGSAKPASVRGEWLVDVVARLPQGGLSRLWGWLARQQRPQFLVRLLQRTFIWAVGIDMAEAEKPLAEYPSLQALFVRRLRPGLRAVDTGARVLVSPVDGRIGQVGTVQDGTLLQIKGRSYRLGRLLGDEALAKRFEGGPYVTLYLAPRDYHRIHAPVAAEVVAATLIPGSLMPVFEASLHKTDELFARNERIVNWLRSDEAGELAVVNVAATLVGCLRVSFDDSLRGNQVHGSRRTVQYDPPVQLGRGDELGVFELGSTVVLLGEAGRWALDVLPFGGFVQQGQRLGRTCPAPQR